ncbi:MAG: hypothetical protein CMH64_03975, partial [Nanoarchaeota archaeon]|nr:hypothetical protein [Nanoarchaeota archaeon]
MEIAAFIDRDGVINELLSYEFGDDKVTYITKKEEIKIIDRVDKAIKLLNENKIKVIVVSNQPQVARGLVTVEEVDEINKHINNLLGDANVDSFYFCPHRPTKGVNEYGIECECRKPKPGLILKAAKEHNVDLKNSFMIGDRISDIKSGNLAGCKTILVETGYGGKEGFQDAVPNYKAKDLYGAVEEILKRKIKLFINAGGKGERLHPLTKDIPKPMVPVNGKPVLHHYVDWAKENDIKEIVMMNGYKAEKIVDYFEDAMKLGTNVDFGHDYHMDIDERYRIKVRNPITTGWARLAEITQGGFGQSELGVVIAPTGAGKSMALVHIGATALKEKKTVIYYTLELAETVVGQRFDS